MNMVITSTANPRIKRLVSLRKKRKARDEEGVFLVEGPRMFREIPLEILLELYVSESFYKKEAKIIKDIMKGSNIRPEILSDTVYEYVSDTKTPQGILCVAGQASCTLQDIVSGENPHILVLDNLQDPGNLGTIMRTAEAAGVSGIIMSRDCVDIYNPKTIRSTMGSVYRVPFCYTEDLEAEIDLMKSQGIVAYAVHLKGEALYDEADYTKPCAFFIGNEGNGLRDSVAGKADIYIRIPMKGQVESLNAASAATVVMFEAGRQRRHL